MIRSVGTGRRIGNAYDDTLRQYSTACTGEKRCAVLYQAWCIGEIVESAVCYTSTGRDLGSE
eukprot:1723737-Rhodomonas_salina.3